MVEKLSTSEVISREISRGLGGGVNEKHSPVLLGLNIKFWAMLIPWKKTSLFVFLGIAEILGFSELSIYAKVVLLKTFLQHLEFVSTANIEEVMKFYNLGNKTFETDFKLNSGLYC